jgi:hypothetical protein
MRRQRYNHRLNGTNFEKGKALSNLVSRSYVGTRTEAPASLSAGEAPNAGDKDRQNRVKRDRRP